MLAAVEWSLAQDEQETILGYESMVANWIEDLQGIHGIEIERGYPSEAGQPFGRALVKILPDHRLSRDQVVAALWDGNPRIAGWHRGPPPDVIALNPQTVEPGEDEIILNRLREILS